MNWDGHGKQQPCPNFRDYHGIYPEELSKTSNNLSQVTGLLSMENGDKELLNRTPHTGKKSTSFSIPITGGLLQYLNLGLWNMIQACSLLPMAFGICLVSK
jgi:hypothetical protein